MFTIRKTTLLRTVAMTRRKAPKFAKKFVKNVAVSSAAEILLHHKAPDGSIVLDVSVIEGLDACVKILIHQATHL